MKINGIEKDYDIDIDEVECDSKDTYENECGCCQREDIKVSDELIDITGEGTTIVMDNIGDIGLFLVYDKKTNAEKYSD